MNTTQSTAGVLKRALVSSMVAGLLLAGLAGCNTTRHVKQSEKEFSGFLGDYSQLSAGKEGQANFVYVDGTAQWKGYSKVYIRNIELWKLDDTKSALGSLSLEDQQILVNALHTALAESLGKNFTLVNKPGPGVLVVHAALTDANATKPVVNLLSTITPIGLVVGAGKTAITGKSPGVGSVSVEAELLDGATGRRVAALVDSRAGTKAMRTKFGSGGWGDVYEVFNFWSQKLDSRLVSLKNGG